MTNSTYLNIPAFELPISAEKIPAVGFGAGSKHKAKKWENPEEDDSYVDEGIVDVISDAIRSGFRHLDCAEAYTTRPEMARAIELSGIPRDQLWITDKYDQGWPSVNRVSLSPNGPKESIEKGLKIFNIDNFDLFLIHGQFFDQELVNISMLDAWRQLEDCYEKGLVKNIGVSNFDVEHLEQIMKIAKYKPQVLQIEYHLYLQNQSENIFQYCKDNNILIEAYCPLTPILENRINDENHPLKPIIKQMATKYDVEPSAIVLRWIYQSGVIPITTSSNFERMKKTFDIFNFELSDDDFQTLKDVGNSYKCRVYFGETFDK